MFGLSLKEVAAVVAVGAGLAWLTRKTPLAKTAPLVVGSTLYTAGYIIGTKRPPTGYPLLQG